MIITSPMFDCARDTGHETSMGIEGGVGVPTIKAYKAFSTAYGRLYVRAYRSSRERDEVEVSVSVISRMALFTSMIQIDVSIKNMTRTTIKVTVDILLRLPPRLC